jgi:hypothetical protein
MVSGLRMGFQVLIRPAGLVRFFLLSVATRQSALSAACSWGSGPGGGRPAGTGRSGSQWRRVRDGAQLNGNSRNGMNSLQDCSQVLIIAG